MGPAVLALAGARDNGLAVEIAQSDRHGDCDRATAADHRHRHLLPDRRRRSRAGDGDCCNQQVISGVLRLMDPRIRRGVLISLVAAAAIACSPAPTAAPSSSPAPTPSSATTEASPTPPAIVNDKANGIAFVRPASWTRWQPNAHNPINDGPLIYLSTEPLLATCATTPEQTPNPPDARGRACDWPLASLSPDGVLVNWYTTRILTPLPSAGERIEVNGATGRLQVEKPGYCSAIGADETLQILVPIGQPKPWSNVAVVACLRGPELATSEMQVRAMLASASVSP